MQRSESFNGAVESLKKMTGHQLAMAGATCRLVFVNAMNMGTPEAKVVAVEMTAMIGEIAKEMVLRMDKDNFPLPEGRGLEESLAKIESDTQSQIAELEAA